VCVKIATDAVRAEIISREVELAVEAGDAEALLELLAIAKSGPPPFRTLLLLTV